MGYFNIIDSLSDKRVDEGMVSSISKNTKKQNKDTKRMVDAVLSGQISKLSSKDMDINIEVRNDTKLSKNNKKNEKYCIVGTRMGIIRTEVLGYEINGDYIVAINCYNIHNGSTIGKSMLYKCMDEDVFNKFKEKMENQGGFDSVYDLNRNMYSCGTTCYNSDKDEYATNTKEALDMIFSYCADSLCGSLSGFNSLFTKWLVSFDSCRLDITSSRDSLNISVLIYLYGDEETLNGFSDEVCYPMDKSRFHATTSIRYGYVVFTFNL